MKNLYLLEMCKQYTAMTRRSKNKFNQELNTGLRFIIALATTTRQQ